MEVLESLESVVAWGLVHLLPIECLESSSSEKSSAGQMKCSVCGVIATAVNAPLQISHRKVRMGKVSVSCYPLRIGSGISSNNSGKIQGFPSQKGEQDSGRQSLFVYIELTFILTSWDASGKSAGLKSVRVSSPCTITHLRLVSHSGVTRESLAAQIILHNPVNGKDNLLTRTTHGTAEGASPRGVVVPRVESLGLK